MTYTIVRRRHTAGLGRTLAVALAVVLLSTPAAATFAQDLHRSPKPPDAPAEWKALIGDYGPMADTTPLVVLENDGKLFVTRKGGDQNVLTKTGPESYSASGSNPVVLHASKSGSTIEAGSASFPHRDYVATTGSYVVEPARPVPELIKDALAMSPPAEPGPFRDPDLVELAPLDPAIHLDIRYASSRNFLRMPVYSQARAFLQRPAAEALVRALHKLQKLGYGLLIHDGYRPWYVTKVFWDATPVSGHIFVADPSQGSRHNRGCAVDLTLYDLKTGQPIEMTGTYDEMSPRSFP